MKSTMFDDDDDDDDNKDDGKDNKWKQLLNSINNN